MATLVLTTVGGALGGPIGAAIGGLAGHALDAATLFRPASREGPRLTELKVQTSSYGTPIPPLFGTMRVAGTVIWSTDLLETRSVAGGGKGQPSAARYSYRASFAVLLSSRPVLAVGRVWADGQLIRGAAGDWKVRTGFRLHLGGEDQTADPLIASAEGAGLAPAHRGCAYAVFEDMALEPFGNRLPSLTFEVIADEAPVGVAAIAGALAPEVSGAVGLAVDGFAGGGGSVAAVLESLAQASGAWFRPDGARLVMRDAAVASEVAPGDPALAAREVAAADAAPAVVTVSHYDPARDWQAGLQRARRAGAGGTLALEVPAAIGADVAKGIAEATLRRAAAGRVRRTLPVTLKALLLAPGDVVTVAGEGPASWRVEEVALEGWAATLTLTPLVPAPAPMAASAGRVLAQADERVGSTLLVAAELSALDDAAATRPRLVVVAAGTGAGWRGAPLLLSPDGGASWAEAGATAAPGVIGVVEVPAGAGGAALVDRVNAVTVALARPDMMLADADAGALDRGANLALIGDELLQFGRAVPLGGGRWRLAELWRGRRGTVAAAGVPGDRFALLTADSVRVIELPLAALGTDVRLMAAGVGDGDAPPVAAVPVTGASVLPPAPVALRWTAAEGGGALVRWTRRSRAGWRWLDRVDAPLAEESERYRVAIGARVLVTEAAEATVTAAERAGGVTVTVRQIGTFGDSAPAAIVVEDV